MEGVAIGHNFERGPFKDLSSKILSKFINCRTVCDDDLNAISRNCPDLEQLDILGTRQVSEESVLR
jgi:hypothetical protein